jgi:peptidyl-prolyl cis-trans isomerase D
MIRFLQTDGQTKKIVLGVLLGLICITMVYSLIPGIGSGTTNASLARGVVATVGGEQVTAQEVNEQARRMLQQQFPRGNPMAEQMLPYFSQRAYENMVSEKAILVAAQNMGIKVSDEELKDEFEHGQYSRTFFPDGKFIGQKEYENLLQENHLTIAKFEELEKDRLMAQKLRALVSGAALVTNSEIDTEFRKRNTKVKFDYAIVNADEIRKGVHPGEEELKAFYEKNKAAYANSIPEKRKLRYALVDLAKVQAGVQVSDAELKSYYQAHGDSYRVPEQVSVRHIIIKAPVPGADGKVDQKALDAARAKADDVLKQIKAGGDFAQLAQKYSEDPSSNVGGMLGWIERGRYGSPDVEKAIFAMPKGQTSDVLKSGYGFHIVRVEDKQDAHLKPLDEVKGDIEPILKQQVAQRQAEAQANALLTQSRATGIEKAAALAGGAVTTDFVSSGDSLPGIGVAPEMMSAAFAAKEKAPPEQLHTPQGYAVYEVLEIQPPSTPTYDQIRSKLEEQFKNERANELLSKKTQELGDRAKASHDLKKAAKDLGLTVKTSDLVLPTGQVPDIGSMGNEQIAGLFTGKEGDIVGPAQAGQNGAVLQLVSKEEPSAADLATKKDEIREGLLQNKRDEMFGMYVANLRQQMEKSGKIVVNPSELKALTGGRGPAGL